MLKLLLDSLKSVAPNSKRNEGEQIVPDISRIIKTGTQNASAPMQLIAQQQIEVDHDLTLPEESEPHYGSPDEMADRAAKAVDSLSSQYDNWMESDLLRLNEAWSACRAEPASTDKARQLFMTAHNIRGVASSYDYPAISRLCGSLCKLLADSKPGENQALINLHVEACRAAFNPLSQSDGAESVADAVCEALEHKVDHMVVS